MKHINLFWGPNMPCKPIPPKLGVNTHPLNLYIAVKQGVSDTPPPQFRG